jgi:hypothetical protein
VDGERGNTPIPVLCGDPLNVDGERGNTLIPVLCGDPLNFT